MAKYTIILKNKATKKYVAVEATDISDSKMYYSFAFRNEYEAVVAAIGTGEGEYYICPEGTTDIDAAEILDRGVLQIGDIARTDTETYNTNKTYEQYEGQNN